MPGGERVAGKRSREMCHSTAARRMTAMLTEKYVVSGCFAVILGVLAGPGLGRNSLNYGTYQLRLGL
jgi:hypothetical protein